MIPYINFDYKNKLLKKKYSSKFSKFIDSGQYINGSELKKFEISFSKFTESRYSVGVASGTCGLHLGIKYLKNKENRNEIITVSNSFIATASTIVLGGCKPVFIDVNEDLNINTDKIEEAITKKTLAIMPVHLTGRPAKMDAIKRIAKKYNLYLIEDAAQAIGSKFKNKMVGSFGDFSSFSLHPLKNLNAYGDGGIITTNKKEIYNFFIKGRNHGLKDRNHCEFWSHNCRLDELQAGFLNIQLEIISDINNKRRLIADYYNNELKNLVKVPFATKDEFHTYQTYVIMAKKRNDLKKFLNNNGVEALIHYPIPIHMQNIKDMDVRCLSLNNTESFADEILSLPLYPGLLIKDQKKIINLIKKFYN